MNDSNLNSIGDLEKFLLAAEAVVFQRQDRPSAYRWVQDTLIKFRYLSLNKFEKGILKRYIMSMARYSRAQITRLLNLYRHTGYVEEQAYARNSFLRKYNDNDLRLLAQTDELHGFPNGCALKCRIHNLAKEDKRYQNLAEISVAYIYKLRKSKNYQRLTMRFERTKAVVSSIGRRAKPEADSRPGYLRVDTVHQGDKNGVKGVYHINTVDETTQFEFIAAAEAVTEDVLIPILRRLIESYPFTITGFHCDNGSEYINKYVVCLLNELLIDLTKSRPRHSNDNGLVETKNGSIIRTWIGYGFIDKKFASELNAFYFGCFNEYLNYHRPCAFASIKEFSNGKIKKIYRQEDYATPYDKFKNLPNSKQYLKKGITFKKLDQLFLYKNCNQQAEIVQRERQKLFDKIFALNRTSSGSLFN